MPVTRHPSRPAHALIVALATLLHAPIVLTFVLATVMVGLLFLPLGIDQHRARQRAEKLRAALAERWPSSRNASGTSRSGSRRRSPPLPGRGAGPGPPHERPFRPLAASVYLLTSMAWTVLRTLVLRQALS